MQFYKYINFDNYFKFLFITYTQQTPNPETS